MIDRVFNAALVVWRGTPLWLFAYLVVVHLFIFLWPSGQVDTSANVVAVKNILRAVTDETNLSTISESSWQKTDIPDNWANNTTGSNNVWYQVEFEPNWHSSDPLAVYLPTVRHNAAAYVNGTWIGDGGRFKDPVSRNWHRPLLFKFTPVLLKAGVNVLHVRVKTHRNNAGYLGGVFIGPLKELKPIWSERFFFKFTLMQAITWMMVFMALVNATLWLLRPNDTFYGWYAIVAFAWALRDYLLLAPDIPLSDAHRVGLSSLLLGWGVIGIVLFTQRYFSYNNRTLNWILFAFAIPAGLPILFLDLDAVHGYAHGVWSRIEILFGFYLVLFLFYRYATHKEKDAIWLVLSGIPLLAVGARDLMLVNDHWDPHNGHLIPYFTPPAMIVAAWFLLRRVSESQKVIETANVRLQETVQQKEQELKQQYEQVAELQKQKTIATERERIMRDVHDGFGGQLVGLLAMSEQESIDKDQIKTHVKSSLADLRMVINSLDPATQDIATLLGTLRPRWQRITDAADIKLKWRVVDSSHLPLLRNEKTLQLSRILEEAVTNAVKHSNASEITVTNGPDQNDDDDARSWIEVIDNGDGFAAAASFGQGLTNMRSRAQAIGAELTTTETAAGTVVRLETSPE